MASLQRHRCHRHLDFSYHYAIITGASLFVTRANLLFSLTSLTRIPSCRSTLSDYPGSCFCWRLSRWRSRSFVLNKAGNGGLTEDANTGRNASGWFVVAVKDASALSRRDTMPTGLSRFRDEVRDRFSHSLAKDTLPLPRENLFFTVASSRDCFVDE